MDGSLSAGNPHTALSRSLPADTNEDRQTDSETQKLQSRARRTEGEPARESPSTKQKPEHESSQTKLDPPTKDPRPTEQQQEGNYFTEEQKPNQTNPEKTAPVHSAPTESEPRPTEKQQLKDSFTTGNRKYSSSLKDQAKQDQPSPTKPVPLNPDLLWTGLQKPRNKPEEHQTQKDFCPTNMKGEEERLQPTKDLTVFIPAFDKIDQKKLKLLISESQDLQDQQDHVDQLNQQEPVQQQNQGDPVGQQNQQEPVGQQNQQDSIDQQNQDLVEQQNHSDPVDQQVQRDPVDQLNQQEPVQQQNQGDPVGQQNQQEPVGQQNEQDSIDQQNQDLVDQQYQRDPVDKQNHGDPEDLPNHIDPVDQQNHVDPVDQQNHNPVNQQDHNPVNQQDHLSPPQGFSLIGLPIKAAALAPPPTIEAFCDQVRTSLLASSSCEPKLCGFLQKRGGPLKAWKQRWFTYEEKKNQLFYYRTPQDVMPLGRVELIGATFTYPLKAERGTFHIQTPERTFILKAVTQQLMLYWLQQLQVKRWQHRQTSSSSDQTSNTPEDFLPVLESPPGLVGEEAKSVQTQGTPLSNMSIKHPFIELQNSVHSLRKRSSQDWTQSGSSSSHAADTDTTTPRTLVDSAPALPSANPAGHVIPADGRESPSLFDSWSRKSKSRSVSHTPLVRRDTSSSSDRMSRLQQEKQMLMEEVKAQKELVWILHKALEASQLEKRTCAEFLAEEDEQKRLELLRHRERQTANLQRRLEEARVELDRMGRSLAQRDERLGELQENIRTLTDKNNAKQEVIIKLSDQVTACLSNPPSSSNDLDSQTKHLQQENENLKDDIEAYKTQSKFLNSEIYQLTKLWRKSSEQEKSLMMKCAFLEASNCQVESRYLSVLRKLLETKTLDPAQRGAVQKMIEDALNKELKSVVKRNTTRDHDEYGFKIVPDYEVEDVKLLSKIQALEIRSHNLLHQEGVERPMLSRWAQYLAGRSHDLCPSPELKGLMRGGVPQEYRQRLWRWVVWTRTRTIRDRHPQHYQQLCEKSLTCPHPASRQIQLDLHRTLTTNQHFSSPSSPALQQLRRILLAFSWQNPSIGYCQGLNRLAAIALLVLQSEEDAFWCLLAVVESIMPQDYYTKNLVASQADQRVLKDFLAEKLPRLSSHFEDHSIDLSLITFNWFLVVFVESLPSDILLPLWDSFLYEGTKVMFRYALALFKYKENDILKIHDSVEIYQYLRFFTKTISDGRKLITIAFGDMNPFPGRLLRNRRAFHLERLQAELQDLEEQQREFLTENTERNDKKLDTMVSESDDDL